jgi:protein O-GlcNAc transferase
MFKLLKSILFGSQQASGAHVATQALPDDYGACNQLGLDYLAAQRWDAAAEVFQAMVAMDSQRGEGYCNYGIALERQGSLVDALGQYRKAQALCPDSYVVLDLLANACRLLGDNAESERLRRRLVQLHPDDALAQSNLLYELSYSQDASPEAYLREASRYGDLLAAAARPYSNWQGRGRAEGTRPLRVGFVSGDFNSHPVGYFLENVITHYQGNRLELIAYPTNAEEDELTARIKPCFAEWHALVGLDDAAAAHKIHDDAIDILIDLSGHTRHNRLPVFAWKPAPLQVSWLGYFASTGVKAIDYLLSDPTSTTDAMAHQFTEKIWLLPETRLCFAPPDISLDVAPLPAGQTGHITFGCFQTLTKINNTVLESWGRILKQLPDARLRLQSMYLSFSEMDDIMFDRLEQAGIDIERVTLRGSTNRERYLRAHAEVDIILDTFPYPGGTTTCEALWMGVPTVTLAGDTLLSRQGASLLGCVGLSDWVAGDADEYVSIAVTKATDLAGLASLRSRLRDQAATSPLFDGARYAVHFEAALVGMWEQGCKTDG